MPVSNRRFALVLPSVHPRLRRAACDRKPPSSARVRATSPPRMGGVLRLDQRPSRRCAARRRRSCACARGRPPDRRARAARAAMAVLGGASLTFCCGASRRAPGAGRTLARRRAGARAHLGDSASGVQLKWPNDVLVHGEKLAGILVELLPVRGRPPAAVIGIGLNLRLPADAAIPRPGQRHLTSPLRSAANRPRVPVLLAAILGEASSDTHAAAGPPCARRLGQPGALPVTGGGPRGVRHAAGYLRRGGRRRPAAAHRGRRAAGARRRRVAASAAGRLATSCSWMPATPG